MIRLYLVPLTLQDGCWCPLGNNDILSHPDAKVQGMDWADAKQQLIEVDAPIPVHRVLERDPRVLAFPFDLDTPVASDDGRAKSLLHSAGIPAEWLRPEMSWRSVAARVANAIHLTQRYYDIRPQDFASELTWPR